MRSDLEIAQSASLCSIAEIARELGLSDAQFDPYGRYQAKLDASTIPARGKGKLILVTAMSPTPAGEGKTTTTIGLADAIRRLGQKVVVALREPSLGPVFGMKGGATGGGYAQVAPMEDINLHFTGDFHAIGAANNLLAAMIDNHLYHGNRLQIDPRRIVWRRCVDMNDRQLRDVVVGLGGTANGVPREDGFDITVASEVMACLCLAEDLPDLKKRLARMIVGYRYDDTPVTADDLNASGAMAALLKQAIRPNLVQTLEHTPALIHGGPFANIAHGCNSLIATRLAMRLGDYAVTEAGFGADLGCEKFIDIKCRQAGIAPSAVVLVSTVRALKLHGGVKKDRLNEEDLPALLRGFPNLARHIANITGVFQLPCVVAINRFPTDTKEELDTVIRLCAESGVQAVVSDVWAKGGAGGEALAEAVIRLCETPSSMQFAYATGDRLEKKLDAIARKLYRASEVVWQPEAKKQLKQLTALGFGKLPVCVAKTQYSFSDNPKLLGAPEGAPLNVRQLRVSAGAGFVVAITGNIMTMPGLPETPAAEGIDIDEMGQITGLF